MATTQAAVCNLALLRCGVTRRIATIDDEVAEARACKTVYDTCLDNLLAAFDWPFATATVALALVTDFTATTDPYEWGYAYRLPTDCVKARHIVSGVRRDDHTPKFSLSSDASGLLLMTDEVDPFLVYTARMSDPSLYSGNFSVALAWGIAVEVAPSLSKDLSWSERAEQRYPLAISAAAASALNGTVEDELPDAESTQART